MDGNEASNSRDVPINSAFYAIALALRHHVPIEVRSDLLKDPKKSFAEVELSTIFPKLLTTSHAVSALDGLSAADAVKLIKRRLGEAKRQQNQEKVVELEQLLESYTQTHPSPPPPPPSSPSYQTESSSADVSLSGGRDEMVIAQSATQQSTPQLQLQRSSNSAAV